MTEPLINADEVEAAFRDCLFDEDEPMEPRVEVEGILHTFGFHPERLESHRAQVARWLSDLPTEFRSTEYGGEGGWTFMNACQDRNNVQWTGLHQRMDQLFALGQGLGLAKPVLSRKYWSSLPAGMPYYVIEPDASLAEGAS